MTADEAKQALYKELVRIDPQTASVEIEAAQRFVAEMRRPLGQV